MKGERNKGGKEKGWQW